MTGRERMVLAAGVTIMAIILLGGRAGPLYRAWSADARADAAETGLELQRARAAVSRAGAVRDSLEVLRDRHAAAMSSAIHSASRLAAGAALSNLVRRSGLAAGVEVTAVELRDDTTALERLVPVVVRAEGMASGPALAGWLAELDAGPVRLAVRRFWVTQPDPAGTDEQGGRLNVTLVLEARARLEGSGR